MKKNGYTVGSMFAGVGGICQGFINNGFQVLWANDFDKSCRVTYEANFKHTFIPGDVRQIETADNLKADVITSGFPCQAFSIAGYQRGFKDPRGNLFLETARFIDKLRPKAFLLENVRNLASHNHGKTYRVIKEAIKGLGYSFIPEIMDSMEYGNVPQTRKRIYIVGFEGEADWQTPDSEAVCSKYFHYPSKIWLTRTVHNDILEKQKVEEKYYYTQMSQYYKMLKEQMYSKNTVYQWRRIYLRENKSGVCPTLTANMGTGGHNVPLVLDDYGIRKLTPRECARLQGFKDSFVLPEDVSDTQLYKQMGNSVTVPVIGRIAQNIARALDIKYKKKGLGKIKLPARKYQYALEL
jgi:DNA (cytosine-5)-methyltransferase 1